MMDWSRRWSFYLAVGVNGSLVIFNLTLAIGQAVLHAVSAAQIAGVGAAFHATAIWFLIATERRLHLSLATSASYLEEQRHDTQIKEAMVESLKRHGAVVSFDGPPLPKARPN